MKDRLKRPKILKSMNMTIEHLTIQLNPTIEKFEEELCHFLHEDRLNMQNKAMDGTLVSIVERRLLVCIKIDETVSISPSLCSVINVHHFLSK